MGIEKEEKNIKKRNRDPVEWDNADTNRITKMNHVDDAYFIALMNDEPLPISDEKYADELTLQEALYYSSLNPQKTHQNPNFSHKIPKKIDEKPFIKQGKKEIGESSQSQLIFCGICIEYKESKAIFKHLNKCNHTFCTDCIKHYVVSKIKENITLVECPEVKCKQRIEPENCNSILPKDVFERWESALFEAMIPGYQKFYCPYKDCSVFMVDDGGIEVRESECPNCKRLFCAKCGVKWHVGVTCEEYEILGKDERESDDLVVFKLAKDKKMEEVSKL